MVIYNSIVDCQGMAARIQLLLKSNHPYCGSYFKLPVCLFIYSAFGARLDVQIQWIR